MKVEVRSFGICPEGEASLYELTNDHGMRVHLTNYGGIVQSLFVPDKNGILDDVVLGFDTLQHYVDGHLYFGALIGRYGNRIAGGKFTIDQNTYQLAVNNGPNSLHGGLKGFDKKLWKASVSQMEESVSIQLSAESPDGEESFPGKLQVKISYTLNNKNEFSIQYQASTDQATILNLTHHSYFNLKGAGNGNIMDHELYINADTITPTDKEMIPTGEFLPVTDTAFDFRSAKRIGLDIDKKNPQLVYGGGYDHNYVLNTNNLELAARVKENTSGRVLEVYTTEPGLHLYTGNFIGDITGKEKKKYHNRSGFCLESQHFPDSPNHPHFPTTVLRPGEVFSSETIYKFFTE